MRTIRLNKEHVLCAAAVLALTAALVGFVSHRARPLEEAAPRALAPAARPAPDAASRAYVPAEARDPRHSPFMPERARPRAETQAKKETVRPEPLAPPSQKQRANERPEVRPEAVAAPQAFGYVGVASTSASACALVRTPEGGTLRVRTGETLCGSELVVERIEKQYLVLKDPAGRAYTLTHDGLR